MHIGFLTPELSHASGWSHYSLSLIQALQRAGVALTVIAARTSPPAAGLEFRPLLPGLAPPGRFLLPRMMLAAPQVYARLRACDLIHTTAELHAPLGAWTAGRRPSFLTGHGSYVRVDAYRRPPVSALYKWAFYRARLICVSRYTARVAQEALPGIQTTVVNNGIDAGRFAELPALDAPPRGPTVLSAGGVKARKGTLELARAMAVVRQRIPDAQCIIIGSTQSEPAYTARVQAAIHELGLEDCVHLLGFVPERTLLAWYGAAQVFVLPSINAGWKFEGYGLTHLEASAAGLPVIGTTDCGAEDAIDDGVTGILVPQHEVAERLPQAILTLLEDHALAQRMGAAGRAKAQRQTWDQVAGQMIALYQAAL